MPGRKEKLWQDGNAANTLNIITTISQNLIMYKCIY